MELEPQQQMEWYQTLVASGPAVTLNGLILMAVWRNINSKANTVAP